MGKSRKTDFDRIVDGVRHFTLRQVKVDGDEGAGKRAALEELINRTHRLLAVERSSSSMVDGYGSTTPGNGSPGGGKGGGRTMVVPDENGDPDHLPTTSTEAAMFARLEHRAEHDVVAEAVVKVLRAVTDAERALSAWSNALDKFDALRSTAKLPDGPQCYVAQEINGLPWDATWEPWRTTDFAGLIDRPFDEPRPVCSYVYWFPRNNRHLHRLPSKEEMRKHLERGTVNVKAS